MGAVAVLSSGCHLYERAFISDPYNGKIVPGPTVHVEGDLPMDFPIQGTLKVNGIDTAYGPLPQRHWSADVPQDPNYPVTEVRAVYKDPALDKWQDIKAAVTKPSIPDVPGATGEAPDGVGMRFTNAGLAGLGPVINNLASSSFDVNALLVGQAVNSSDATGTVTDAGLGNVTISPISTANGVRATVTMSDMNLGINLNVSTLGVGYCRLEVDVPTITIDGYYDLKPGSPDPNNVDVNLIGGTAGVTNYHTNITIPTVNHQFTDGNCDPDVFLIGPIISSIAGSSIPDTIRSSFDSQLADADGAGPNDNPIADAVETALGGISISGAVGSAVQANLDSPLQAITEDANGITFRANANFASVNPTTSLPTCTPSSPFAPDLQATVAVPLQTPAYGNTTPGGQPYGLGLGITSSAFNQMIGAMTECGLVNSVVTEFGGQPMTSTRLANLGLTQFNKVGVDVPIKVLVNPTVAPFIDGNAGPNGEPDSLYLANLLISFVQEGTGGNPDITWLTTAIDAPMGFDLAYDQATKALKPTLTPPPSDKVRARLVSNKVGMVESQWEYFFPLLFPGMAKGLGDTFAAFPLPDFLGLSLNVIEIQKQGTSYVLYSTLDAAPAAKISGITVANGSDGAYETDSCCFNSYQFRHRVRKTFGSNNLNVQWQGGIFDDSCCLASDSDDTHWGKYTATFTVTPAVPGGTWQLDLNQHLQGAFTRVDDGSNNGFAEIKNYSSTYKIGSAAAVTIPMTISPATLPNGGGNANSAFSSGATPPSLHITGTGTQVVVVVAQFQIRAFSDAGTFTAGDEVAVRMGMGDTLANGFTAGGYPYPFTGGNRNPGLDGHFTNMKVCNVQAGGAACPA